MKINNRDYLLMALFHCGPCDLKIIEDFGCEFDDIVEEPYFYNRLAQAHDKKRPLTFLIREVIEHALYRLEKDIEISIKCLETEGAMSEAISEENEKRYQALLKLKPYDDIDFEINFLATEVWFTKNEKLYRKYVPEAIDDFEYFTGFPIERGNKSEEVLC